MSSDGYIQGGHAWQSKLSIGHFTVVCLVTWPWIGSEARGDLVLVQTSPLFIFK